LEALHGGIILRRNPEVLCLSHEDTCEDADGNLVTFGPGMILMAFDEDVDEHGSEMTF
jgi:hypothetical protein